MNHELYTDEFRSLKYLKSDPIIVEHFRATRRKFNEILPIHLDRDASFTWTCRIEFLEQVFDLKNEALFIVDPSKRYLTAEGAMVYQITKPVIFGGDPFVTHTIYSVPETDIPVIEALGNTADYYLTSRDEIAETPPIFQDFGKTGKIVSLKDTPLTLGESGHLALFYNKNEAEEYWLAVSEYLKKCLKTRIAARL